MDTTIPLRLWLLALLIGLMLLHSPALAQPLADSQPPRSEASPSTKQVQAARENFLAGRAKMKDGFFELALSDFKLADAVMRVPTTRLGVAEALVGMGRLVEARRVARSIETIPPAAKQNEVFAAARERAQKLAQSLTARISHLTITWPDDAPFDVAITLDDKHVNRISWPSVSLEVDPSKHAVHARAAAFKPFVATLDLTEGEARTVNIRLIDASTNSRVAGTKPSVPLKSDEAESRMSLWPVAVGGCLTLAAAGLGTGMWLAHQSVEDNADELLVDLTATSGSKTPCTNESGSIRFECSVLKNERQREELFKRASIGAFITGGVTAIASLGYLVGYVVSTDSADEGTDSDEGTSARVQFTPSSVTLDVSF